MVGLRQAECMKKMLLTMALLLLGSERLAAQTLPFYGYADSPNCVKNAMEKTEYKTEERSKTFCDIERASRAREQGIWTSYSAERFPDDVFGRGQLRHSVGWQSIPRGLRCDAEPQDLSPAVAHDEQPIEQPKRDGRHHEQIHRRNAIRMIAQERFQPWDGGPLLRAIYAGLPNIDAELEQFAMNARRTPTMGWQRSSAG
jgi:hypothetical protein